MILNLLMACTPAGEGGNKTSDHVHDSSVVDSDPGFQGCEGEVGIEEGMCAPDFSLISADGTTQTLSELGGQKVVVLGAASW